ncbi:uncharacterized protein LOC125298465 isoform X2 [Alosa alosa]|uniref:uncharacterized protein LOC125298465 isoform X2 n=1 Tax=Alosa alosa TaxID=278164 RepID=UPI0020153C35|nr:uncharacterized protein LOC125298465 isoform X2 [Alosa alosa]
MSQYLIILSFLLSVLEGVESEVITVQEGQDANIKCFHALAHDNIKYFCRHPCRHEDILITSKDQYDSQPRFSLADHGTGKFDVTISKVTSIDAGTYYCGVGRYIKDTFEKVILNVICASTISADTPSITTTEPDFITTSTAKPYRAADPSGSLVYVLVSVGVVAAVMGLIMLILYTQRKRRHTQSTDQDYANAVVFTQPTDSDYVNAAVVANALPEDQTNIYQSLQPDALHHDVYQTLHRATD